MSSVLDGLGFNADSLSRNKFCMGRKYVCDCEADEEERSKAVELLHEAVGRIWHWRIWMLGR